MKTVYRIIRVLAVAALCGAVLLPAMLYVALSITPVQRRIAREAEKQLSSLLDSKVTIGSLGIVPFNRVILRNVAITNREGTDTLLTARRLGAGIRLSSLLSSDPTTITCVELIGMNARIHRDSIGSPLNIQPIITALKPKHPGQPPKPFNLRINTVMIRTSTVSYDVLSEPPHAGFDKNHLAVNHLRADITLPRLQNDDFAANIRRMGFATSSGMQLESLTARATLTNNGLTICGLALTLPHSSLLFEDITVPLHGISALPQALHTEQIQVGLLPGSHITPADLAAFAPQLSALKDRFNFNRLIISGNTGNIKASLDLASASGSTHLTIDAEAHTAAKTSLRAATVRELSLTTNGEEISAIASCFATLPPKTTALLGRMGSIRITANGNLKNRDFSLTLAASCAQGETELIADGQMDSPAAFSAEGEISTIGPFDVGALLGNPRIGNFDGSATITYGQSSMKGGAHRRGTADINVDLLEFNGTSIHQLLAGATLTDNLVEFNAEIDNPAIALEAEGEWSLARDHKIAALRGRLDHLDPHALHLTSSHAGTTLAGEFDIDLAGKRLDNMLGHIHLANINIARAAAPRNFTLREVNLQADSAEITLTSDIADGKLTGPYDFRCIGAAAKAIAAKVFPSVLNLAPTVIHDTAHRPATTHRHDTAANSPTPSNDFTFNLTIKETESAAEFFHLPLSVIYPVKISGEFSEPTSQITLALDAPYLRQGNKLIENTRLSAQINGNEVNSSVDFTTNVPTRNGPLRVALTSDGRQDRLSTELAWKIDREKAYRGHVGALTTFWRAESGGNTTGTPPSGSTDHLVANVNLLPGSLTFNDSTWTVNPGKVLIEGTRCITIDGIDVHRANQFVKINGEVSERPDATLTLDLRNFNLDYLFESLGIDKVQLGGDATGTFHASRLLSGEPVLETPGLAVSNISYNKVVLGDALVKSHWQQDDKAITLDAVVDQPNSRKAFINGAIFPMNDSLDIHFNVDHTNVAFMQPYMEAFASDISGHASGHCRLWGNFKYIDLEGDVMADDLRMKINFTNTYYTATDSVHFRPGLIDLNGITIRDAEGHTADLNGWVRHKFFKEPWFEFSISNARDFLSYNETSRNNPRWYGKIYGNGGASVKGAPGQIDIHVDMATAPRSTFTFVLSDQEEAESYSFLTFRDKNRLSAELTDTVTLRHDASMELVERLRAMVEAHNPDLPSNYNISLQMRVTPDAQLVLVMDPVAGDRIRAWGSGHLRMDYGSANNDLRMYGTYNLDRGYYNFTLQDVIIKDFTIKPGSEIVFNGDPYAAQLNIQAIYALNANLSDLDESFLQDKDLNRTNVPVHALMKVSGDIRQPEIAFDLEFPTLTSDIYRKVRSIVSTDDMMNRQIIYLLALNRFYTPEYMTSTTKGNELVSVASSTISSQLSNMLGQISDNWNIAPTFRSDRGDFSDVEVDVALSSRLLNNRLLFNGNFGYRDNSLNTNQFIGDFDLEYLLDREGKWRLKAYNRYNDQNYYLRTAKTTQGVGVSVKWDFDSFFPFLRRKKEKIDPTLE